MSARSKKSADGGSTKSSTTRSTGKSVTEEYVSTTKSTKSNVDVNSRKTRTGGGQTAQSQIAEDNSTGSQRARSPSPVNITREEEKQEIASLNERLANYIEHVRSLEIDNEQLTKQLSESSMISHVSVSQIRREYDNEMQALRRDLDDLSLQQLESELRCKELREKSAKLKKEASIAEPQIAAAEQKIAELKTLIQRERTASGLLLGQVAQLEEEAAFQRKQSEIEAQQLAAALSLELHESSEICSAPEYESRLASEMQLHRTEVAMDLDRVRAQLEADFQASITELEHGNSRSSGDLLELRLSLSRCEQQRASLLAELESLRARISRLRMDLESQRDQFSSQLAAQSAVEADLQAQLDRLLSEFKDLLATKVSLDQELQTYRRMLEGEESRLQLTPPRSRTSTNTAAGKSGLKRDRRHADLDDVDDSVQSFGVCSSPSSTGDSWTRSFVTTTTKSKGLIRRGSSAIVGGQKNAGNARGVAFYEIDTRAGQFVRLKSLETSKSTLIGGWQIRFKLDGREEPAFTFPAGVVVPPGGLVTVWSQDCGVQAAPPHEFVLPYAVNFLDSRTVDLSLVDGSSEQVEVSGILFSFDYFPANQRPVMTGVRRQDEKCRVM